MPDFDAPPLAIVATPPALRMTPPLQPLFRGRGTPGAGPCQIPTGGRVTSGVAVIVVRARRCVDSGRVWEDLH
jgi:hypothetical protein